jgi:hypothetical protein
MKKTCGSAIVDETAGGEAWVLFEDSAVVLRRESDLKRQEIAGAV